MNCWRRFWLSCVLVAVLPAAGARAQQGYPDPAFGSGGVAVATVVPGFSYATDVAIQADGRIVAAGNDSIPQPFPQPSLPAVALVRYLADGSLDPSFGSGGVVLAAPNGVAASANALAIQPGDGAIIVVGATGPGNGHDALVMRLLADGTPDPTFGSGGVVTTDFGDDDGISDVKLDAAGNLVVCGFTGPGGPPYLNYHTVVARYLSDGALDPSFGTGGFVVTDFDTGFGDFGTALAFQPSDGRIVIAGETFFDNANAVAITAARYLADGSLDATFGTAGLVITPFDETAVGTDVVVQPDGKVVVSADAGPAFHSNTALVRYLADGTLDDGFGNGGRVSAPFGTSFSTAAAVVLQGDGRIVVTGSADTGLVVARFLSDGSRDGSFGSTCGAFVLGGDNDGLGLALDSGGDVVVAGRITGHFAVARILGGSDGSTVCTPVGCATAAKQKLVITRLVAPGGDERLMLSGQSTLADTTGIDPGATGVHTVVQDAAGAVVLDAMIPGGAYDAGTRTGWKTGTGSWKYLNPGTEPHGIRTVAVKTSSKTPGLVKFKMKGKDAAYPVDTSALPLRAELALAPPTDRCIAATWPAAPPASPSCAVRSAETVRCR